MDHDQLETAYLEIYNDTASNADAAAGTATATGLITGAAGWEITTGATGA